MGWRRSRMMKYLILALAIAACASAQTAQGNVSVLGDITVTGALRTSKIRSNQLTVDGSINVVNTITAEQLTASEAEATVNATLHASSFIQRDVKQWALAVHGTSR